MIYDFVQVWSLLKIFKTYKIGAYSQQNRNYLYDNVSRLSAWAAFVPELGKRIKFSLLWHIDLFLERNVKNFNWYFLMVELFFPQQIYL